MTGAKGGVLFLAGGGKLLPGKPAIQKKGGFDLRPQEEEYFQRGNALSFPARSWSAGQRKVARGQGKSGRLTEKKKGPETEGETLQR